MINMTGKKFGYKLFEMDRYGNLYPLFIDKKERIPVGEWLHAKFVPTKGFSPRGGWHLGADVPDAPWLRAADGTYKSQRGKTFKRVWGLCEYNSTTDYNPYVQTLKEKAIVDGVPENGYYLFRECGKGTWVISSDMRVVQILSQDEVNEIIKKKGYDCAEAFAKYGRAMAKAKATRLANEVAGNDELIMRLEID